MVPAKPGVARWIGRTALALSGWTVDETVPDEPRYVLIAAPHTSNWDLYYALAAGLALGVEFHWLGKHTLFAPPFGGVMRWLGGIAVDRRARHDVVRKLADEILRHDRFVLMVPPEGTRKKSTHWKSGFYWIAATADVPIAMGYLDYGRKRAGIGPLLRPSGDVERDVELLRAFYADKSGKFPDNFSEVRFRAEDAPPAAPAEARPTADVAG